MRKQSISWVMGLWLLFSGGFYTSQAQNATGLFEDHADVGVVLHPGSAEYNAAERTYTVAGSGENMWFAADALHFAWKKVSGDVTLTANISFIGTGGNAHRKAVLMIRQSLDADSAYADVAVHGSGLTSLQARDEKGATTHEVQSAVSAPARVRIARRGDYFYMWLAGPGEDLRMAGGSMRVPLHDPVYVGIGVCSHDKDVVEKAVFSNVDLAGAPAGTGQPVLYSTLETVPISSGDRRVVYVAAERLASPRWSPDGAWLSFKRKGRTERVPAAGGEPAVVDTVDSEAASDSKFTYFQSDRSGSMQIWRTRSDGSGPEQLTSGDFQNCFPHVSPDGKQMVFLSYAKELSGIPEDQDVMLRLMSLGDAGDRKIKVLARLVGGKGTIDAPSWSPDSRSLAFVSYQLIQ
jgi:regulation of enolase protein 1 (concanavalin A-like superfamily)